MNDNLLIGTEVGPIVGGQVRVENAFADRSYTYHAPCQMYDHIQKGWFAVSILGAALLFTTLILIVPYTGDTPLLRKLCNLDIWN